MLLYESALVLLLIKHWLVDFVWQTPQMLAGKGQYGQRHGLLHSLQHGAATFLIFVLAGIPFAISVALIDMISHYHIDWIKSNYGNSDSSSKQFWNHLGLDQLAHGLVYLLIVGVFIRDI